MPHVVLLTGGNLAHELDTLTETLAQAREELSAELGVELACSSLWESEAWGFESSDRFLNQVVVIETQLPALEVLARSQAIEQRHGRVRSVQPVLNGQGTDTAPAPATAAPAQGNATLKQSGSSPSQAPSAPRQYASRTLDIDILFYDNQQIQLPQLEVPHPRIAERLFVLCPLAEILPERVHPTLGVSVQQLLDRLRSENHTQEPTRVE